MSRKFPAGKNQPDDFEIQYQRIFAAAACLTQTELADLLEIRQSSISDAKRRKSIPAEWLITLWDKKRISPDWIRFGIENEQKHRASPKKAEPPALTLMGHGPTPECTTDELLAEIARRAISHMG